MLKGLAQKHRDFSPSVPIIIAIEPSHLRETYFFKSPKSRSSQRFLFSPGIADHPLDQMQLEIHDHCQARGAGARAGGIRSGGQFLH